jgi:hypothetical protein
MTLRQWQVTVTFGMIGMAAGITHAADVPVIPKKLIVVDKLSTAGRAKVVFVAKDEAAGISKGEQQGFFSPNDPNRISVRFDVAYGNGAAAGGFAVPAGASVDTGPGWVTNKSTAAKYVNRQAPGGPTNAKVAVIKPDKLLKLVGKSLGDEPLDILGAGDPGLDGVQTAYCVLSGTQTNCHCSTFSGCVHKPIAGGTGAKLVCRTGGGDATCSAVPACVDNGLTVTCRDLEWEKKDTAVGSGPDAGNLHDVDNLYSWTGECMTGNPVRCQPNAAAAATCNTLTGGLAFSCSICVNGEADCDVDPLNQGAITTIWDWLNQVNAANYSGHSDWRAATSVGASGPWNGDQGELDSIVDDTEGECDGGVGACIDPVFGPTAADGLYWYWTGSSTGAPPPADESTAWVVAFESPGGILDQEKRQAHYVRAVRDAP